MAKFDDIKDNINTRLSFKDRDKLMSNLKDGIDGGTFKGLSCASAEIYLLGMATALVKYEKMLEEYEPHPPRPSGWVAIYLSMDNDPRTIVRYERDRETMDRWLSTKDPYVQETALLIDVADHTEGFDFDGASS